MPNLYPGIKPFVGDGRSYVLMSVIVFLPFFAIAQPIITGLTPESGPVGATVTISGSNFSATPASNIVYFGSVKAAVTAASTTSLSVTVPAGASYQPVTVTTGGLTAFSAKPFIITFSDPGQFTSDAFGTRWDFPIGNSPVSIFSTDMDGDGKPDLLVANTEGNTMEIYRNTSTTANISFSRVVNFSFPANYDPLSISAGDLDGDGKPEVLVANYGSPKLAVFQNTSTSGSITVGSPAYLSLGNYTMGITIGDCNSDGKPEIIVASQASDMLSVFRNSSTVGTLNFTSPRIDIHLPAGSRPADVIISDLDGDGRPDLATVNSLTNTISVCRNTSVTGGTPAFYYPLDNSYDFSVGSYPTDLAVGDLDGDGKPDLAVVNNGDATITLMQNNCTPGSINFVRGTDVPTGTILPGSPWALVMADFDGDGKPDIASINQLENTVSLHRNISTPGTPAIDANVDYSTGDIPYGVTSADFDGDGLPDLAILDNTTNFVTVLRNKSSNEISISSFMPTSGSSGTVVSITGTDFTGATDVSFGGVPAASFTVNSATSITATVASGATGAVSVTTPSGTASLGTFTYSVSPITIIDFAPNSGGPGTVVTINGSNFTGATGISFGGVPATAFTVLSDNQITAVVGNGNTGPVTVTAGPNSGSLPGFFYVSPPVTVVSFSPQSGSTGQAVIIKGQGFLTATKITFGGTAASNFTINGDTSIIAYVAGGASGSVAVFGSSTTDSLAAFTYINNTPPPPPPPSNGITISAFSPLSGSTGDTIHIYGTNLSTANSISFGGMQALQFQALSDTVLLAVVGSGSSGYVRVANINSSDSLLLFTYMFDTTSQAPSGSFQLIQFSGSLSGSNAPQLQWQVKNDAGISYYAVERSSDSIMFSIIGTVKSTRTNGASHTYTYSDPGAGIGTNWYRLKMQDTTAAYTYSKKIRLKPATQNMPVYPNPVKYGFFYIDVPDVNSASQLQVFDINGKRWQTVAIAAGTSQARINVPGLPQGAYKVTWTNGTRSASSLIIILRP